MVSGDTCSRILANALPFRIPDFEIIQIYLIRHLILIEPVFDIKRVRNDHIIEYPSCRAIAFKYHILVSKWHMLRSY